MTAEVVEGPTLKVFKARLDRTLSSLVSQEVPLPVEELELDDPRMA